MSAITPISEGKIEVQPSDDNKVGYHEKMGEIRELCLDPVSFELMTKAVSLKCGHELNANTVKKILLKNKEILCPLCREPFTEEDTRSSYLIRAIATKVAEEGETENVDGDPELIKHAQDILAEKRELEQLRKEKPVLKEEKIVAEVKFNLLAVGFIAFTVAEVFKACAYLARNT